MTDEEIYNDFQYTPSKDEVYAVFEGVVPPVLIVISQNNPPYLIYVGGKREQIRLDADITKRILR